MALNGQFQTFFGLHAIFDFAKLYFKFPVTGIVNGIRAGILDSGFAVMKPGAHLPGKKKSAGHSHRPDSVKFIGIE